MWLQRQAHRALFCLPRAEESSAAALLLSQHSPGVIRPCSLNLDSRNTGAR
jgi:hypothetical protein